MSTYTEKFKDPRWQKRRLEILERDGWTCQVCSDTKSTLNVHHKYYEKGKDPWDYEDSALVTLCDECHDSEHIELKEFNDLLINTLLKGGFLADDLREIAYGFHIGTENGLPHSHEVVASAISHELSRKGALQEMVNKYFLHLKKRRSSKNAKD